MIFTLQQLRRLDIILRAVDGSWYAAGEAANRFMSVVGESLVHTSDASQSDADVVRGLCLAERFEFDWEFA